MSENPFTAPIAATTTNKRPWLRKGFAIVIALMGVGAILSNVLLLAQRILLSHRIPWSAVPWKFAVWELGPHVTVMLVALLWLGCAAMIWRGRWRVSLALLVISYAFLWVYPTFNEVLRSLFAGDEYTTEIPNGRGGMERVTVHLE